jgi:hypothetical protein
MGESHDDFVPLADGSATSNKAGVVGTAFITNMVRYPFEVQRAFKSIEAAKECLLQQHRSTTSTFESGAVIHRFDLECPLDTISTLYTNSFPTDLSSATVGQGLWSVRATAQAVLDRCVEEFGLPDLHGPGGDYEATVEEIPLDDVYQDTVGEDGRPMQLLAA